MQNNLQQQYNEVRSKYPQFNQTTRKTFSIDFQTSSKSVKSFIITISDSYPNTAPSVSCGDSRVHLPIFSMWNSSYTLLFIVEQLSIYAGLKSPKQFNIDKQEIQKAVMNAKYDQVKNPDKRLELIKNTQTSLPF